MPPPYDSVVKGSDGGDEDVVVVPRRRRDGGNQGPRSQARLSLPPLGAAAFLRTHRRAESDIDEHIYEDPTSLRRRSVTSSLPSCSGDCPGVTAAVDLRSTSPQDVGDTPAEVPDSFPHSYQTLGDDFPLIRSPPSGGQPPWHRVYADSPAAAEDFQDDAGRSTSSEVDDRSPAELLASLAASAPAAALSSTAASDVLLSLPYAIASIPSLGAPPPLSTASQQPRVPRVRLGTSALYSRPDWCRTGGDGDFPAPANQLRAFSPLSAVGYTPGEVVVDSSAHPYQTVGDDLPLVRSPLGNPSFGGQAPWYCIYGGDDPELEFRSQLVDVHSSPSRSRRPGPAGVAAYFSNDISLVEDRLNSTSSAHSSLTDESERMDLSQVSPLFDD